MAKTVVCFRHDQDGVFALFPYEPASMNPVYCLAYTSLKGHTAADYTSNIYRSVAANPEQYAWLLKELQSRAYGYDLEISEFAISIENSLKVREFKLKELNRNQPDSQ